MVSPGGTETYSIIVKNEGSADVDNVSVIAVSPMHMDYVTGLDNPRRQLFTVWTNDKYTPVPYVRWDFEKIASGETINLNYQLRVRIGEAQAGQSLPFKVYVVPILEADEYFDEYAPPGDAS
jgi:uncharacterized repeat protein (TIGR01451 family)